MLDALKRPVDAADHPLSSQSYIVPTPAIAAMYARVRHCLRRGVTGALIYGHTRWGKTYAVRYCVRLLRHELPRVVVLTFGMPQNPSQTTCGSITDTGEGWAGRCWALLRRFIRSRGSPGRFR
ncbi:hypothetical protein [Paraburkholderia tropica]|uniref:hypothetical protein n=1 Tax=Paraburkholderia tropica TaxID=92647 RepID=UPI000AC0D3AC|nr:hypothetical protein [Paraburkholderia tropica]